jgi:serine/threonine protein kinase
MKQILQSKSVSFKLLECLGEGSCGVVYKAIRSDSQNLLSQTVALKILKSKNSTEEWKNEFESLARVQAPTCVRVYGFEWLGDRPALAIEYVEGISLRQLLLSSPLELALATEILSQIQEGLNALKKHDLCHGDLSPNNVMISIEGFVKLVDFGLANTKSEFIKATPEFAAPEVLDGSSPNWRSDLFSLGKIEEILTGTRSSRVDLDPSARLPFAIGSSETIKKTIGKRIRHVRDQQNRFRQLGTRPIAMPSSTHFPLKRVLFSLFLIIAAPDSQGRLSYGLHDGLLKVRSQHWLRLHLDGEPVGFTPLDIRIPPGAHILSWDNPAGSGKIKVDFRPDETKVQVFK